VVATTMAAVPTGATTATATLTSGTLELSAPSTVSFSTTLNGLNQTTTASQHISVADATGSGTGWNLQGTSTTFCTSGNTHCLSNAATIIQAASAPTVACAASSTCTVATNAISYPYTLPAGSTAPTATKFYDAEANTGMGDQTVTATFTLAIPANSYSGTYHSTWTYSLVSAP
jgi:hypothetical protein